MEGGIERERESQRERERERHTYYIYIYRESIYIYIQRERERESERERERERPLQAELQHGSRTLKECRSERINCNSRLCTNRKMKQEPCTRAFPLKAQQLKVTQDFANLTCSTKCLLRTVPSVSFPHRPGWLSATLILPQ